MSDVWSCSQRQGQASHTDWETCGMEMAMEKSWNVKKWQKVMEFCYQNVTSSSRDYFQICTLFTDIKKVCIGLNYLLNATNAKSE